MLGPSLELPERQEGMSWLGWGGLPPSYPVPVGQVCVLTFPLSPQRGVNTDSGSVCREASFEGISK